jgi:flagellar biosynthetic protein FliR
MTEEPVDIISIPFKELKAFYLILIRVSIVFQMFPFFNAKVIPILAKVGLSVVTAIILFPVINPPMAAFPHTGFGMMQLILAEFIIGIILGLLVTIFFEGVRMMGQMVGFQTGFAITNIIDPQSGSQISILANMAYLVAMIFFLLLNGHHILLNAVRESFEAIPVGSLGLNGDMFGKMISMYGEMFVIAVKIGAPAIGALLFTNLAFGLITKLIPQMNIMIVAFPIQIVIGLLFFGVSLNVLLYFTEKYLKDLGPMLVNTMGWLRM